MLAESDLCNHLVASVLWRRLLSLMLSVNMLAESDRWQFLGIVFDKERQGEHSV